MDADPNEGKLISMKLREPLVPMCACGQPATTIHLDAPITARGGKWQVSCNKCYAYSPSRLYTFDMPTDWHDWLSWTIHLSRKGWMTETDWRAFVERVTGLQH